MTGSEPTTEDLLPGRGPTTFEARADAGDVITEVLWSRAYGRHKDMVGHARKISTYIVAALRREGLITGTTVAESEGVLSAVVERAARFGEVPRRGISHLVAEALVLLDLPVVHRDVVALLMPDINTGMVKNTVKMQFGRALRKFHNWKWINRGEDGLITVLDRDALVRWYEIAQDTDEFRASTALNIAGAIQAMREADSPDELRRRELQAMQRLMLTAPGSVTNERGRVRLLAKPDMV